MNILLTISQQLTCVDTLTKIIVMKILVSYVQLCSCGGWSVAC